MMNKKHLLFVHIPKTAGTSFRKACQKYFGEEDTFYDYGRNSVETSKEILDCVYDQKDLYKLYQKFEKHENMFLSGHFPTKKYMHLFQTLDVITFVREPVSQVLSHYKHFKTHYGYEKSFHDFIKEDRFKNVQSRYLNATPLEFYGFIGLTERYNESLEMINDCYGIKLEELKTNIHQDKDFIVDSLDDETIELIKKENIKDIQLYEKAKKLFTKREKDFREKKPYVNLWIAERNDKLIQGCAFSRYSNDAIEIEICLNGTILSIVQAKDFKPGLLKHGLPRRGYVGFRYDFKNQNEKNVVCKIKESKL